VLELYHEAFEDLQYMDGVHGLGIDLNGIETSTVVSDVVRLKIILRNISSHAIRFRRKNQKSVIKGSTNLKHAIKT
jgi:hypothetical protein